MVGGAIEPAETDLLRWALWVCDFGRYGLPFDEGAREWVTDVNVSYKRDALEATRALRAERFSEPILHWAFQDRGETLFLSPRPVVVYLRSPTTLEVAVPERFHWGLLFGAIRATRMGPAKRAAFVVAGPIIPLRVFFRHAMIQRRKGRGRRFVRAAPLTLALLFAWSAGEVVGYLTGRP